MARRRIALLVGTYLVVVLVLTILATLLLVARDLPLVLATFVGFVLAQTVVTILLIPVRIYIAWRKRPQGEPDSN